MRHLFVCINDVASGKPACGRNGGRELLTAVHHEALRRGASVHATGCACLGPCFDGPNAVVYPDAVWYGELTPEDAAAIVAHLVDGIELTAKRIDPPGESRS